MVHLIYVYSWQSDDDDHDDDHDGGGDGDDGDDGDDSDDDGCYLDVDYLHGRHHLLLHPLHHIVPGEPALVPHTAKDLVVLAGHLNVTEYTHS